MARRTPSCTRSCGWRQRSTSIPAKLLAGLYGSEMLPERAHAYSVTDFLAARKAAGKK